MLFNKATLDNKVKYLDSILKNESLLRKVLGDFSGSNRYKYELIERPWDPGGGSTLFSLVVGQQKYFLKVKSCKVFVESKLEAEESFTDIPSLRNEYEFFQRAKDISANTPKFFEYVEEDDFSFLFIEHLSSFKDIVGNFNAKELLEVYEQIKSTLRKLYEKNIVHTDVHENNIMFRGNIPVLIDFEEAKVLSQEVSFEESLDVTGENSYGNVGRMPEGHGFIDGYTCLNRLKKEFKKLILSKLDNLVKDCNFDSSCPFLNALDHGKDERIYQSINLSGYSIEGQRPLLDDRIDFILRTIDKLFQKAFTHLDIGSNLGRFNIEISKSKKVKKSIGIEAYDKYVDLAKILAFLGDSSNVEFIKAECGKDSLSELLGEEKIDLVTLYSVYHHIEKKKAFIEDLIKLNPSYLMFEMPVQKECYDGKSWEEEISLISQEIEMPYWYLLTKSNDYKRPIVLVSKTEVSKKLSKTDYTSSPPPAESFPNTLRGRPRVSIVLPTYNHLRFLPQAVESILRQTFSDFELIIVNDGSTDGTREYLDNLKNPRIKIIHQENKRLPEALNAGFKTARGELLTWVSSDNYCAPIFLEALVAALDTFPEAGLACSAYARIDEHDQITCISRDQDLSYHSVLAANPGIVSFIYRRDCQEKVGMYDPELEGAEDWDMWIRIVEQFQTVYVPEILYYYRRHSDSMTDKIPDKVFGAGRKAFQKAVSRRNNQLNLVDLYPTLELCQDKETAKLYALFDLGTAFLRSPLTQVELACKAFESILSISQDFFGAASNLAVAYGRAGKWEKVAPLLRWVVKRTDNPKALEICRTITEAYQRNKPDLLTQIPLLTVDKKFIELFQLEKEHQLVFRFTNNDQRKDAAKYRGKSQVYTETPKQLAEGACVKNQYQEIAHHYNRALKCYPHNAELWNSVGHFDQKARNLTTAQKASKYAQSLDSFWGGQRKLDRSGRNQSTTAILRESLSVWELSKIPKKAHFYWGNQTISFLRYLTIYSFKKLNPDWEINIYIPREKYKGNITWQTGELYDGVIFKGKDYTKELFSLGGINIKEIDFSSHPFINNAPENYKSDLFRWYILNREGGLYSDTDILYFRPMNDLFFNLKENNDVDAAICLQKYGHIIGFLLSSQDNPFFKNLLLNCEKAFDSKNYQSISAPMVNKIYPSTNYISKMFPDLVFYNMPMSVVYALDHMNIPAIFYSKNLSCLTPETIGIHWYAGHTVSQEFNNVLTHENFHNCDNIIAKKIKEIYP